MQGVRETLTKMDGVESVVVDYGKKLATCTVVPDKFDSEKAIAALNAENYGPSAVVTK